MRKILALLLALVLLVSLANSSNPTMAQDGGEGEGGGTSEAGTPSETTTTEGGHETIGRPDGSQQAPGGQEQLPPEGGFVMPDAVKVGVAVGVIGVLAVAFFVWTKRGVAAP